MSDAVPLQSTRSYQNAVILGRYILPGWHSFRRLFANHIFLNISTFIVYQERYSTKVYKIFHANGKIIGGGSLSIEFLRVNPPPPHNPQCFFVGG